ncbi:cysteine synthase, chloroplastic/chromoplastic-like isoform X1 [Miscanthus floridulus]|uniref:cysteine synthase, chloroplastic/chromoplastic-like isoform X1 n=1 Tax=Miscanthus floridulus TaxID=154761 RepID=UPI003458292D
MDGEEVGRRGIPSLLKLSSSSIDGGGGEQEHIASDITQLIGWTPLIELKRITSKAGIDARIVGKIEAYQPLCSIKDRSALRMIEDAEERGLISPGVTTLVEPTSDPALGFPGMFDKVEQLRKQLPNVHVLNQVTNKANSEAHFRLTGPEIWKDTAGKVDIFVAGSGTGGTVSGVGKYLKMQNPGVKIICVEPAESPVISGGVPGKHKIQGVGPGFIPEVLDTSVIDETVTVTTEEAMVNARRLAKEEGLLVGISSGANLAACLKVASREENRGKMIVTVFPSGGERYMNSDLFADVREECIAMKF